VRGRRCEPAHVAHTLARLAEIRGQAVADVAGQTAHNARRLFGLPARATRTSTAPG
jgi:TatD DNase family protein